jgi:hypothetical protein
MKGEIGIPATTLPRLSFLYVSSETKSNLFMAPPKLPLPVQDVEGAGAHLGT